MPKIELNDAGFRDAEANYMKANDKLGEEGTENASGFLTKELLDELKQAKNSYYETAGVLAERLKKKYLDHEAGIYGQISHFNVHEEEDGTLSIICISVGKKNETELVYNQVRLADLKKALPAFELPFGA